MYRNTSLFQKTVFGFLFLFLGFFKMTNFVLAENVNELNNTSANACPSTCTVMVSKTVGREIDNTCYISLSWKKVPGATAYRIFRNYYLKETTADLHFIIRNTPCKSTSIIVSPINPSCLPSIFCPGFTCTMPYAYPGSCR